MILKILKILRWCFEFNCVLIKYAESFAVSATIYGLKFFVTGRVAKQHRLINPNYLKKTKGAIISKKFDDQHFKLVELMKLVKNLEIIESMN